MCTHRRAIAAVALACSLPGCDLDFMPDLSGPGLGGATSIPTTQCLEATRWKLIGFEDADVVVGEAMLLPIGHSRNLLAVPVPSLAVVGCEEAVASVRWRSTRPGVAGLVPGQRKREAWLTGLSAGEAVVSADVTLTDGRTMKAPLTWNGVEYPVRVAEGSSRPEGRQVLLEGSVELEPEARRSEAAARAYLVFDVLAAGVLDMFVDWDSPSNEVTAHMCPGKTRFPHGCVPIIDGTRYRGVKPVSAATHTVPRPHTLWITNDGPGADRITYQVGLIPD